MLGINIAFEDFAWNIGNLILIRILNSINEYAAGIYMSKQHPLCISASTNGISDNNISGFREQIDTNQQQPAEKILHSIKELHYALMHSVQS